MPPAATSSTSAATPAMGRFGSCLLPDGSSAWMYRPGRSRRPGTRDQVRTPGIRADERARAAVPGRLVRPGHELPGPGARPGSWPTCASQAPGHAARREGDPGDPERVRSPRPWDDPVEPLPRPRIPGGGAPRAAGPGLPAGSGTRDVRDADAVRDRDPPRRRGPPAGSGARRTRQESGRERTRSPPRRKQPGGRRRGSLRPGPPARLPFRPLPGPASRISRRTGAGDGADTGGTRLTSLPRPPQSDAGRQRAGTDGSRNLPSVLGRRPVLCRHRPRPRHGSAGDRYRETSPTAGERSPRSARDRQTPCLHSATGPAPAGDRQTLGM